MIASMIHRAMDSRASVGLTLFFLSSCGALAQVNPGGQMTRLGFEVGVSYEGEPIAQEKTVCNADEWSRSIDWGDQTPEETLKSSAVKTYGDGSAVPKGSFVILGGKHQYNTAQQYKGTLYIRQHCLDTMPGTRKYAFPFTIEVFARVPIQSVEAPASPIRGGDTVGLIIKLEGPAPLSNTRVFLEADKAVFSNIPRFKDVPANASETTVLLPVRRNAPAGDSALHFWTDPDPAARKSVSISIAP